MPTFAYLGDKDEIRLYGLVFRPGEPVPVENPAHIEKLRWCNRFSEIFDCVEVLEPAPIIDAPKRRGRPPKAK